MNVAVRRPRMSMDEFLAWEIQQPERWEFDGFEPRLMVGGTVRHHRIIANLATALRDKLAGRCMVFTETVKLRLGRTWRYPDIMVVCSPVPDDALFVSDPTVVVEVLSASTARSDRLHKNAEYAGHTGIRRYILIEPDEQAAEIYARDGGHWTRATVINDGVLEMPEIGVAIPLSAAYAGMDVPLSVPTPDGPQEAA